MTGVATGDGRDVLETSRLPAAAELHLALRDICGSPSARLVGLRRLKTNVYRAQVVGDNGVQSFILKCSNPGLARHNQLVARRWLPAIGLADAGARLEGSAADRHGERIWLIYEDLGDAGLDSAMTDRARVRAAVDLIARLHVRSAGHAILPDCRVHGGELGAAYFAANVRDAVHGLELLRPPRVLWSADREAVRARLLGQLRVLQEELPDRIRLLEHSGPEVLLHGDLWTTNTFVLDTTAGLQARLVDWDHTGVGRASYDLSTFLLRFPEEERSWILDRYRAAVAPAGWELPDVPGLNALFETAEYARYANRAVWPAVALLVDGAAWAFDELAMVATWFDDLRPVLPDAATAVTP